MPLSFFGWLKNLLEWLKKPAEAATIHPLPGLKNSIHNCIDFLLID